MLMKSGTYSTYWRSQCCVASVVVGGVESLQVFLVVVDRIHRCEALLGFLLKCLLRSLFMISSFFRAATQLNLKAHSTSKWAQKGNKAEIRFMNSLLSPCKFRWMDFYVFFRFFSPPNLFISLDCICWFIIFHLRMKNVPCKQRGKIEIQTQIHLCLDGTSWR